MIMTIITRLIGPQLSMTFIIQGFDYLVFLTIKLIFHGQQESAAASCCP